jgi:prepilin-type processing-associated H-X9-DG protein
LTNYPINVFDKLLNVNNPAGRGYVAMSMGSYHPGGANVAFGDIASADS